MENKDITQKVVVTKHRAFIPLINIIKSVDLGTKVYESSDLTNPYILHMKVSDKQYVVRRGDEFILLHINRLVVAKDVVLFEEIENYTHYQTKLKFDEFI